MESKRFFFFINIRTSCEMEVLITKKLKKISPLNFYERHPKIVHLDIILFNYCVALIHVYAYMYLNVHEQN